LGNLHRNHSERGGGRKASGGREMK
jgi:hypothetical protein